MDHCLVKLAACKPLRVLPCQPNKHPPVSLRSAQEYQINIDLSATLEEAAAKVKSGEPGQTCPHLLVRN